MRVQEILGKVRGVQEVLGAEGVKKWLKPEKARMRGCRGVQKVQGGVQGIPGGVQGGVQRFWAKKVYLFPDLLKSTG